MSYFISLTSVVCKILEDLIREKIEEHLKRHQLLSNKQFGFRKGKSTTLQLLKVLDEWTEMLENGHNIDILYTDFQKAFDSVPHNRLLLKLNSFGLCSNVLNWIKSFLTGRKQRVNIKGRKSLWAKVLGGVLQGSVLGPLLFILYINDILDNLTCTSYVYADDMKVFNSITTEEDKIVMQNDINTILHWTEDWLLKLNVQKCKVLQLHNTNKNPDTSKYYMKLNDEPHQLEVTHLERDLGVNIDENLTFEHHIYEAVKKANRMVGILKYNFKDFNYTSFSLMYKSLVMSHLEYAQTVWSPFKLKYITMLEKVQRATKILPSLRNLTYSERLKN